MQVEEGKQGMIDSCTQASEGKECNPALYLAYHARPLRAMAALASAAPV